MRVTLRFLLWVAATAALVAAFTASMITRPLYDGATLATMSAFAAWVITGIRFQLVIRETQPEPWPVSDLTPLQEQLGRDVKLLASQTRTPTTYLKATETQ